MDSLSKYESFDCPDSSLIAEVVRNDPRYVDQTSLMQHVSSTGGFQPFRPASNRTISLPGDSGKSWGDIDSSDDEIIGLGELPAVSTRKPATSSAKESPDGSVPKGAGTRIQEVHRKKLSDLREVLAVYKNQPRTHHFGHHSEPTSVGTSKSATESIWARWVG